MNKVNYEGENNNVILHFVFLLIAIPLGIVIGIVDYFFGSVLLKIGDIRSEHFTILIPFLAIAGLFIVFLYDKYGKNSSKGMGLVFYVAQNPEDRKEEIPLRLVPFVAICTWLTHLFGGSAGREGVAVQLGATLSDNVGKYIPLKNARFILILTGMAAGFAGLFQTPFAAVAFALEVVVVGKFALEALFPAMLASIIASETSHFMGLEKFSVDIAYSIDMNWLTILKLAVLGISFGIAGRIFSSLLSFAKKQIGNLIENKYYRILAGGLLLSVIFYLLFTGRYSGLGTNLIAASFEGNKVYYYDWILKIVLTVITLAVGFQGGEVTPLFSIGATLGVVLGGVIGLPTEFVAALGYVGVFGSASNTLIAPILIGGEVFGFNNIPYFIITCVVAYLVNGNKSIYLQKINN